MSDADILDDILKSVRGFLSAATAELAHVNSTPEGTAASIHVLRELRGAVLSMQDATASTLTYATSMDSEDVANLTFVLGGLVLDESAISMIPTALDYMSPNALIVKAKVASLIHLANSPDVPGYVKDRINHVVASTQARIDEMDRMRAAIEAAGGDSIVTLMPIPAPEPAKRKQEQEPSSVSAREDAISNNILRFSRDRLQRDMKN